MTPQAAEHLGDSVALVRACMANDVDGAVRLLQGLEPAELLLVVLGLAGVTAGIVTAIAASNGQDPGRLLERAFRAST